SVILIILSGALFVRNLKEQKVVHQPEIPRFMNDILPGDNIAVLTLDDGSRINLNEAGNGLLARESNTEIEKSPDGQLHYIAGAHIPGSEIKYNTSTSPRGGQFQIMLPDGSRIWLNAGSSLRFPASFTGSERKVEL